MHGRDSDPGFGTIPRGARPRRKGREEKGLHPGPREGPRSGPPPTWRVLSAALPGRGHGPYLLVIPAATPSISPQMATVPQHLGSGAAPTCPTPSPLPPSAGLLAGGDHQERRARGGKSLAAASRRRQMAGLATRGRGGEGRWARGRGRRRWRPRPWPPAQASAPPRACLAPPRPRPGLGPAPFRQLLEFGPSGVWHRLTPPRDACPRRGLARP